MLSHNLPECALSELLYADDLVLMSEAIEGLMNKLLKWKEALESKGLKVNLFEVSLMARGGIRKDSTSKSKVDPYWLCSLRVKADSVLCLQCGKWMVDVLE